ncbi:MAG: VCBS repeat-containing protein [Saprospiraceae bacterium]|nr:VCBS repeat-containing protein [Saprospiraceae bacterium]
MNGKLNGNLSGSGKILAQKYCGSCHQYPSPDELPTGIWHQFILPHMGHRLGIYSNGEAPDSIFKEGLSRAEAVSKDIYPAQARISKEDWQKLENFYLDNSIDSVRAKTNYTTKVVINNLVHFNPKTARHLRRPPLTTMLQIIPEKRSLLLADGKKNVNALISFNENMDLNYQLYLKKSPIFLHFAGDRQLLLTIGEHIYPTDYQRGELELIYREGVTEKPNRSTLLIDSLRRPVHFSILDFNQDGQDDFSICEFGNRLGSLTLYENQGNSYMSSVLIDRPGAIKTEIRDVNGDGWSDILVLMAQGDEGIFLLYNQMGSFNQQETLLSFSALAGSTYFESVDWDGDEDLDLLYTCGDNADLSIIVKEYHGIYLFKNLGSNQFVQHHFFPMPGAYKAVARDFDQDGDLDISAISFFPDYRSNEPLHYVYLEQESPDRFSAQSFAGASSGRWMVMDAGDLDEDGDIDIALGSYVGFYPDGDKTGLYKHWLEEGPAAIILENQIKN